MTVRPPSKDELAAIARGYGMHPSEEDLASLCGGFPAPSDRGLR
jgi:hypothetical protein